MVALNNSTNSVRIAFLGDTFFGEDTPDLSPDLRALLASCDAVVANLECPICDLPFTTEASVIDAAKREGFDKIFLRSALGSERLLADWNIRYVSLANNHFFDCGADGLASTRERLGEQGIRFTGAGNNLSEASEPIILNISGVRLGIIAATEGRSTSLLATDSTPGCNTLEMPGICGQVAELKRTVDHVFVLPHWGICGPKYPETHVVDLGEQLLDAGASVVVGHHSHRVHGYRRRNYGKIVCYSLGNFYFGSYDYAGMRRYAQGEDTLGAILVCDISKENILDFFWRFTCQTETTLALDNSIERMQEFDKRSAPFQISVTEKP